MQADVEIGKQVARLHARRLPTGADLVTWPYYRIILLLLYYCIAYVSVHVFVPACTDHIDMNVILL